jgi:tyrosine-protein kinase Etk/Wzc
MVESLNVYTSKKIVENEIEVIKSKTLMRETVRALHLSSPVYEEGLFSDYPAYTSSPFSVEIKDIDQINPTERVDFFYSETNNQIQFEGQQYPVNVWIRSPYGEFRFVKNTYFKKHATGQLFVSFLDARELIDGYIQNLNVVPSNKLSTVINLSFKDPVPIRAENILNTLIESYNQASLDDKNSLASNTLEFVESRIKVVEYELDSLERSIQQYKSSRGIVDLSEQGKVFLKNVGDNDQKLSDLNMQLAALDRVEAYVVEKENSEKLVPATLGLDDSGLAVVLKKLYDAEIEYSRLKQTTAENNPLLVSLRDEIESMRPGILENIRNQKASLIASRSNLTSTNTKYASALGSIPQKEKELLEATRQQAIKNNVYTFLLEKREETAMAAGASEDGSRLVDRAEASIYPVAPKKLFVYGASLAIAFFLGIAWVAKKEDLNNNVLFRSEIESSTKIPITAEISDSQMSNHVVIDNLKKPYLTEQFTQLRTAAGLFGNKSRKTVMVTSAIAGEGKSFISTNFAISLAGSDRKVLLMDLDLRNPRLSNLYNATSGSGVAEFLNGEIPIEKVVRRTRTQNLFLISAGNKRTSATEKILEGDLQELFTHLHKWFDYIVIDTPPVTPVIDAYIISPYCDATLFVVRHGKTPKKILHLLGDDSKIRSMKNISIVFNGLRPRGLVRNAYGYGYGYGYEYGYSGHYP